MSRRRPTRPACSFPRHRRAAARPRRKTPHAGRTLPVSTVPVTCGRFDHAPSVRGCLRHYRQGDEASSSADRARRARRGRQQRLRSAGRRSPRAQRSARPTKASRRCPPRLRLRTTRCGAIARLDPRRPLRRRPAGNSLGTAGPFRPGAAPQRLDLVGRRLRLVAGVRHRAEAGARRPEGRLLRRRTASPGSPTAGPLVSKPTQLVLACGDGNYYLTGLKWSGLGAPARRPLRARRCGRTTARRTARPVTSTRTRRASRRPAGSRAARPASTPV